MNARKTYVLIPVMPTPNGPLHLGHVAGPFLKMDMLARHLRRNGETVALVSATDPYETHVLPRADEQNKPVEAICAENHRAIHRCLQALDIRYDAFIDPLASPYRARLNGITREVLDDLDTQGLLYARNEPVHVSRRTGRMIVGSRIVGTCPCCGVEMGGYHCEGCGMEVWPRDLIAPRAEPADDTVEAEERASVFLDADIPALKRRMLEARVPADVRRIAERFMHATGGAVRLSNPGEWGWTGRMDRQPHRRWCLPTRRCSCCRCCAARWCVSASRSTTIRSISAPTRSSSPASASTIRCPFA